MGETSTFTRAYQLPVQEPYLFYPIMTGCGIKDNWIKLRYFFKKIFGMGGGVHAPVSHSDFC